MSPTQIRVVHSIFKFPIVTTYSFNSCVGNTFISPSPTCRVPITISRSPIHTVCHERLICFPFSRASKPQACIQTIFVLPRGMSLITISQCSFRPCVRKTYRFAFLSHMVSHKALFDWSYLKWIDLD
jgi:hypothetical protein